MQTEQEDSSFVSKGECGSCGSSDANALYTDGHSYCFSCGKHTPSDDAKAEETKPKEKHNADFIVGEFEELPARQLTEETCKKFGYRVGKTRSGKAVQIAEYRDRNTGQVIAQHLRTRDKDFPWIGNKKKSGLFGHHLWKEGGKKIVVTEGEIDAMSVSQLQNHKWPVVSILSGCDGAVKDFKDNISYLESFEEVVILFDMDEVGQEAALKVAEVLSHGKAYIAQLPLKDANDMLKAGRGAEVIQAIWNAKVYRPEFYLSAEKLKERFNKPVVKGYELPFSSVSEATYGVRLHEIWTLLAGSGMGKTEVFKEFAHHFATKLRLKSACIFLEETPEHTAKCFVGKSVNARIHVPDVEYDKDQADKAFDDLFTNEMIFIHDHQGDSDFDRIYKAIQYYVQAHGVSFIFLDHITAMAEGKGEDNTNGRIHMMMEELNKLTQRLPVTIFLISHIRKTDKTPAEEGGRVKADDAYGSGAIKQRSNFIWSLERNQQKDEANDEREEDESVFRCLKDRYLGKATGRTLNLIFSHKTGRLREANHGFTEDDLEGEEECPF